ncbi:hypothetical protein [Kribbella sp. VKM Ac-2568]|uniref:YqeB family protein n=1 Tax=Kribbella sp. VKM Ac-2568 TaxID=2512219 RepID=UPI0010E0C697|nr:hypothetical protein [Kribbella sp. VKM Ac-2568]TCM47165.1 hypothetical protein EV648_105646 [Kribbella sp. VKM Ac-2568]
MGAVPGPLELIAKADSWWVVALLTAIGVVASVFLAAAALEDTLKVTMTNTEVEFLKNQKTTRVPRNHVAVAFLDGNAVLKARSKVFALGDEGKHDVRELREEVAKPGYTVRDEDKRQYWRPTTH